MSNISRVCPQCGKESALEARFCASCGYDSQAGAEISAQNLPVPLSKAALPVLAGVAGLALRAGWKLMQSRVAQDAARGIVQKIFEPKPQHSARATKAPIVPIEPEAPASPVPQNQPQPRTRRTIRVRTSWAVGDARGVWRHGTTDQTIEIDE